MGDTLIQFQDVTKRFKKSDKSAVKETSLGIEKGSFVTILGTSGSGKTTLLKMVNRLYEPTSGQIFIYGEDISSMKVTELRRKMGYVIQNTGLFPHMSIEENIAIVPKILKWDKKKINQRVDELLELVHLDPLQFRTRYPSQLSGGQQQRVGLARAMASDPEILLMDEPFGAIDAITRVSLQDELLQIQKKLNKTILFVTHDIDEALKLGDQLIVMDEGIVQQYGRPIDIILQPANEFVSKLVQSNNAFQLLGLLKAEDVMIPIENQGELARLSIENEWLVDKGESLKHVLNILLEVDKEQVIVVDESQEIQGIVTFEQLKLNKKEIAAAVSE
ncbi:ABC transporter ATP-binding protein [Alkalihalobacillus pseudalcaliphilus]|uniref:ABC transporter ATP-binding protein n=1 Tax=Alkalihalobacillus pseudalcaliphilus TaxID=79884 RepID=UPI00064D7C8F|nr:ABC transporter ATP-binding protein [Alkalihalobacillus pseudalcaliphilus]KMK75194.1 ABC transporter ATP-binding protein [Alkalihalobacillus pseudalcaliphilus]